MEASFSGVLLYKYCSMGFGASIHVLCVMGVIEYLQHGCCHHALF